MPWWVGHVPKIPDGHMGAQTKCPTRNGLSCYRPGAHRARSIARATHLKEALIGSLNLAETIWSTILGSLIKWRNGENGLS